MSGAFGSLGGGIYESGSGSIARCMFVRNEASAGDGVWCAGPTDISDCVFVRNTARGGAAVGGEHDAPVSIKGCTIVGNSGGSGVGGVSLGSGSSVESTIIAWNEGYSSGGTAMFSCNDIFGNTLGDQIFGEDAGNNLSFDPEFCAADPIANLYFMLQEDSPCAPGNPPDAPCGLIGAAPVGVARSVSRKEHGAR